MKLTNTQNEQINTIEQCFGNVQNLTLDEFNIGKISLKEMKNILEWCVKMRKKLSKEIIDGLDIDTNIKLYEL